MPRLLVVGLVPSPALGDLLQYYVATELLRKHLPSAELTLAIPDGESGSPSAIAREVHVLPGLGKVTSLGYFAKHVGRVMSTVADTHQSNRFISKSPGNFDARTFRIPNIARLMGDRYYASSIIMRYIRPAIARTLLRDRFSAGIVGGHTIEPTGFLNDMICYFVLKGLTGGPVTTFPISISNVGIRTQETEKLLKRALSCFDRVFVRGPYSFGALSKYVPRQRIGMALDSGFGIKLLLAPVTKKESGLTRVAIIPRIDYFYYLNNPELLNTYMDSLSRLIRWMIRKGGVEVYLTPQTLRCDSFSGFDDVVAIHHLLGFLGYEEATNVKVLSPKSLVDTYESLGSMDLVITSRMHGGITAMSAGSPVLFLCPAADVKVLDVLSSLGLDANDFMIDIFDAKQLRLENLVSRVKVLLDDIDSYQKMVRMSVDAALPQVELPVRALAQLMG